MELPVFRVDGTQSGETLLLNSHIFDIKPNNDAIFRSVIAYRTHNSQGTNSTKNRSAVRGGGRKPYRQKGTGNARAGTNTSPIWVGGGRTFGPSPRSYNYSIPKKVKQLALRSALSARCQESAITVVEDFDFEEPKTKRMIALLEALNVGLQKTLILMGSYSKNVLLSSRNISYVTVRNVNSFSTFDILNCQQFIIQKSALEKINTTRDYAVTDNKDKTSTGD